MPAYIIRKIDEGLWARFKRQAALEGRPLRWIMIRLVALYAEHGLDALETAPKPKRAPIKTAEAEAVVS